MIDVAGGDKVPRKGGPGITRSDLLVINKIDLAPYVGASLEVMDRDARKMRGTRPFLFTNVRDGVGLDSVIAWLEGEMSKAGHRTVMDAHDPATWTIVPHSHSHRYVRDEILPPLYDVNGADPTPMGAAELKFGNDGRVAWDEMWQSFAIWRWRAGHRIAGRCWSRCVRGRYCQPADTRQRWRKSNAGSRSSPGCGRS